MMTAVADGARAPGRLRTAAAAAKGRTADVSGYLTGRALAVRRLVPGVAGAALLSVAAGEIAGHVFGHGLTPWVASALGAVFLLVLDRRL